MIEDRRLDSEKQGEQKRILLVDDEEGYIAILAKRLGRRNFDVRIALSGSEAIRILRKDSFDLAVVDLKMEDMDGIEVLRVFKVMEPKIGRTGRCCCRCIDRGAVCP